LCLSLLYPEEGDKEPPCEGCYVELYIENKRIWKLYTLCQNQVLRAGMDGTVVGLDHNAVIETLKIYGEGLQMFEEILYCWSIAQELNK